MKTKTATSFQARGNLSMNNNNNATVGIDVGTYYIKVIVAEKAKVKKKYFPKILATGVAESRGMRHGYIVNVAETQKSIKEAVRQAEKTSGLNITKAFISISGIGLQGVTSVGKTVVSSADIEVKENDMKAAQEASETQIPSSASFNRKVIHAIPLEYKLDGQDVLGNPLGLKGNSLEVKTFFITCLEHHLNDLVEAVESIGIEVIDTIAAPIASSFVSLTKPQKIAGCVLADIGAETVSIVVFENNIPISLEVFPIGGTDITNDIALGLKIPLEEAEKIKLGSVSNAPVSEQKLEDIISARLTDIFEIIISHLKNINRHELLPAGIIITGGSSGIFAIEEKAKDKLNLPSSVTSLSSIGRRDSPLSDSRWSVAYGLCIIGLNEEESKNLGLTSIFQNTRRGLISWIKQFLP
ncbi:MAG: cell division protein FtsA [Candidatus Paceibacterota bacterium]